MNLLDLLLSHPQSGTAKLNAIGVKQFLGLEGEQGYIAPTTLLSYCRSLREGELKQKAIFYQSIKDRLRILDCSIPKEDKGGRLYTFIGFKKPLGNVNVKLILESGMDKVLDDYLNGKLEINFTLEELITEALKH